MNFKNLKNINYYFYNKMEELFMETHHPEVQVQYSTSYVYYINLVFSVLMIIVEPVLLLTLYQQFNSTSALTMSWFFVEELLGIYSLLLSVANEEL